jgi:hypothetical protein
MIKNRARARARAGGETHGSQREPGYLSGATEHPLGKVCLSLALNPAKRRADRGFMNRIKAIFFFVVVLGVGVFLSIDGFKDYKNSKRIAKEGKQTVGKVTDSEERRGRRGRRSYYLTVAYETEGKQSFEQELKVSSATYNKAEASGTVPVHYLPSDPNICAFGEKVEAKFGNMVWGALAFIGSFFFLRGGFGSNDDDGKFSSSSGNGTKPQGQSSQPETCVAETSSDDDSLEEAA